MARSVARSANADAHERAENRLLRKMASLHKEKVVMAKETKKMEERRAGRKGAKAEHRKAEHRKEGRKHESHGMKALERAAEAKHGGKKPGHMHHHHHHHHHHGGAHAAK